MKKFILFLLIAISISSCVTYSNCPTTNKRYFTKGIKGGKPLYKGYSSPRYNPAYNRK